MEREKTGRMVVGTGMGRAIKWNCKALYNFSHCRTGKGRIGRWRHLLDPLAGPACRRRGEIEETGNYIALPCPEGEWIGRR